VNGQRLRNIEAALNPPSPQIIAATVAHGLVRSLLMSDGVCCDAAAGLTKEQLPVDCLIHHYDPANEIPTLTLCTDGVVRIKQILGVSEEEFLAP
jgi:hypothetical protein